MSQPVQKVRQMEDTPGPRIVQAPLIVPQGLYDRQAVISNLGISKDTFSLWVANGLPIIAVSKRYFVYGAALLRFLRQQQRRKGA